jgi:K(+)-stimulated pyrophosphate-energized sodium pump
MALNGNRIRMAFNPLLLTTSMAVVGVLVAIWLVHSVQRYPKGNDKMIGVWKAIRQGSNAYLKRQFTTIAIISVVLAVVIVGAFGATFMGVTMGAEIALSFLLGVAFSLTAAYIAMYSATNANVRTTAAAGNSTYEALKVATMGGAALGLAVISMSLLGLSLLYAAFGDPGVLAGFGFGASLAALFAQLGGGIFTKSADVGADLVGKVEENFPEDDPRNPATIADNVGDNVGDEAGRGADLFESLTAENLGGMIIGLIVSIIIFQKVDIYYVTMPLIVRSLGIIATLVGLVVAVYEKKFKNPIKPTRDGLMVSAVVAAVLVFVAIWYVFGPAGLTPNGSALAALALYGCVLSGLVAGLLIVFYTEYYTGAGSRSVIRIAERSQSGPALTVMSGTATGMMSTGLPVITVASALLISFGLGEKFAALAKLNNLFSGGSFLGGVYGTTMAAMGMLSIAGIVLTMDGLGPIVDNAGGIAEMSGAPPEVRERLDPLDALGNTTKALTKGYAMGSAALASLLLFQAFVLEVARYQEKIVNLSTINSATATALGAQLLQLGNDLALNHPAVVIGVLIGGMLPFLFSGTAIEAVSIGAYKMVEEVRRQFRENPGLREGTTLPDYSKAVDISTRTALRLMVTPGLIAVVTPIVIGVVLGWAAVGALVIGATVSAVPLAIMMMWGGAALDNAKKYVEAGNLGGKGTATHAATVVGDTVGDPWKDTAGPSLHILIKLLNTISLVFIPLFLVALIVF